MSWEYQRERLENTKAYLRHCIEKLKLMKSKSIEKKLNLCII